ncbi:MAG: hypothetical protein M3021_04160 [Actinomycetota bacterium]|nr:hypothetical protein [Actinomycetota bacterium]
MVAPVAMESGCPQGWPALSRSPSTSGPSFLVPPDEGITQVDTGYSEDAEPIAQTLLDRGSN